MRLLQDDGNGIQVWLNITMAKSLLMLHQVIDLLGREMLPISSVEWIGDW